MRGFRRQAILSLSCSDILQVMVKFTVEQALKARKESSSTLSINLGPRCGWVVNTIPRPFYPQERNPVRIIQKAEWDRGPV
jgi:hypothetical protein